MGLCAGEVASVDGGSASFFAMFDGGDTTNKYVTANCILIASWPSYYGDVYFGADNCLYDTQGKIIH